MADLYILKTGLKAPSIEVGNYSLPVSLGTAGQFLSVNNGNLEFTSAAPSATTLASLTDVTLTSLATGEILQYNGTDWVNVSFSTTGMTALIDDTNPTLGGNLKLGGFGIDAQTGNLNITITEGGHVNIGNWSMMAPEDITAVEVTPNTEYTYTFNYPATNVSTYVDYVFKSTDGWKMGTLFILTDGTTTSITDMGTELQTPSIDFTASISGSNVQVVGTNMATTAPQALRITMRQMG